MIKGAAVNVLDFGAVGNGIADDTTAINAALVAAGTNGSVIFPEGNYKITSSVEFQQGQSVVFNHARFTASGAASNFNEIKTGGSDAPLGLYTMLDLKDSSGANWDGLVVVWGSDIPNLCGIAASTMGFGGYETNFNAHIQTIFCEWGIYAQSSTTAIPGTLTGSRFAWYQGSSNNSGDIFILTNQDDIEFDTVRSTAPIVLGTFGIVFNNLFITGAGLSSNGMQLNADCSVVIQHAFIEGDFQYPFLLFQRANLTINSLQISPNCDATHDAAIFSGSENAVAKVNVANTQSGLSYVVARSPNPAYAGGRWDVTCPCPLDLTVTIKPQPIFILTGGASSTPDVFIARMTDATWNGTYAGSVFSYNRFQQEQAQGYLNLYDQNNTFLCRTQRENSASQLVVNLGEYYPSTYNASIVAFNSTNTAVTIYLGASSYVGQRIRFVSSNTSNDITLSTASGVLKLVSGGTTYALLPNQANAITCVWDGVNWCEESRIAY
jgi:hypothetical protein